MSEKTRQDPGGSQRRRRSFWFDPRFAIGLALIAISVLGVSALVSAANASVDVLAARSTLTPGQRISLSDLAPTSVRAGTAAKPYLRAADVPTAGLVVTRAVSTGELVPVSAVGKRSSSSRTPIVVTVNTPLAEAIVPGSRVDVWSAKQITNTSFGAPRVLASSAIVVRIIDQKTLVASSPGESVELLVPRSATASVLSAIANGAALSVLASDLPLGK